MEKHMTPVRAIRAKCLDCCAGSAHEVKLCTCPSCSLYPFRLGKNPNRTGKVNGGAFVAKNHGSTDDTADATTAEGNYTPEQFTAENCADSAENYPIA